MTGWIGRVRSKMDGWRDESRVGLVEEGREGRRGGWGERGRVTIIHCVDKIDNKQRQHCK